MRGTGIVCHNGAGTRRPVGRIIPTIGLRIDAACAVLPRPACRNRRLSATTTSRPAIEKRLRIGQNALKPPRTQSPKVDRSRPDE
jgi:hypothetical protein